MDEINHDMPTCCHQVLTPEYEYYLYEKKFAEIENKFNSFGYIPLISTISGVVRSILGFAVVIAESINIPVIFFYNLLTKEPKDVSYEPTKHLCYMVHATLNIFRGFIEAVPGFGNLAVLGYDNWVGRVKYLNEWR